MKNILFCFMVLGGLAFSSCQKNEGISSVVVSGPKPTAAFTNNSGSLTIAFTNSSTNGDTYYWKFGDGTTSTEASPVHTYSLSGYYTVTLKTNSAAGYSSTVTKTLGAAQGLAIADFTTGTPFGLIYYIDASKSANFSKLMWDFGDGTKDSTSLTFYHQFPTAGTYTVKLRLTGFFNDVIEKSIIITANGSYNLLLGGDMEAGAASYWKVAQNDNPPVFGYTSVIPSGGYGGCLRFPDFTNWSSGTNTVIYQAVNIVSGKKYKLSAVVKAPAGGVNDYLQFHISPDPGLWNESSTYFLCLNNWHNWGSTSSSSTAVNGDLYAATLINGQYGLGVATGGVYTATYTGKAYILIQCGVWGGKSNGDILVDNVTFSPIN
jgi:PKD repeat protein